MGMTAISRLYLMLLKHIYSMPLAGFMNSLCSYPSPWLLSKTLIMIFRSILISYSSFNCSPWLCPFSGLTISGS